MGDENQPRTLRDYSRPSHNGYQNTIDLPERANVASHRSDTIRLVQNGCSFHGLRSEDPNQHLKDFLKIINSLDLNGADRKGTRRERVCVYSNASLALRVGKLKVRFTRTLRFPRKVKKKERTNLDPMIPTNIVNRRILEWEEKIEK
ncbi:hypothetical protein Tco_0422297 [Tanacetum coccineum]